MIAGSEDPVGRRLAGVRRLVEDLAAGGLTRLSQRFYAGARHELFHETQREQVVDDLVGWLEVVAGHKGAAERA